VTWSGVSSPSGAARPSEIVTTFIRAIERRDVAAAVAMTSEDVSYENMPIQPIVGRTDLTHTLEGFLAPATNVDWQILAQWEFGRTVINERLDRFEIGPGWLELPVAGFFEIDADGLIARWRDYFDLGSYQAQLSALTGS
jgi:limonene-1,2-epoxide hydrolase